MALNNIMHVGERFLIRAKNHWWAYRIANEWNISPLEVKRWEANDILEALAFIALKDSKEGGKT